MRHIFSMERFAVSPSLLLLLWDSLSIPWLIRSLVKRECQQWKSMLLFSAFFLTSVTMEAASSALFPVTPIKMVETLCLRTNLFSSADIAITLPFVGLFPTNPGHAASFSHCAPLELPPQLASLPSRDAACSSPVPWTLILLITDHFFSFVLRHLFIFLPPTYFHSGILLHCIETVMSWY